MTLYHCEANELGLQDEYCSTVDLICQFSHIKGEYEGKETKTIALNTFEIVYFTPDSIISIVQKFELLTLMRFDQNPAFQFYRSKVRSLYLKQDSIVLSKPLMIYPLLFCNNCDFSLIDHYNYSVCDSIGIDNRYIEYLNKLHSYTLNIQREKETRTRKTTSYTYYTMLTKRYIISNEDFRRKYNCILEIDK